jgi:hypothetical protein
MPTRPRLQFLSVLMLVFCCSACLNGQGQHARARVLSSVQAASQKLQETAFLHVGVSALTFTADGQFSQGALPGASLTFTGDSYGPFDEIDAKPDATRVREGSTWRDWNSSDEKLVAARIPAQHPQTFTSILEGVTKGDEYGGVEVKGKSAFRYDVFVSVDKLVASSNKNAQYLGNLYKPYAQLIPMQVDIDKTGNILRILFPAKPDATVIQATAEGGAYDAISVDFNRVVETGTASTTKDTGVVY